MVSHTNILASARTTEKKKNEKMKKHGKKKENEKKRKNGKNGKEKEKRKTREQF